MLLRISILLFLLKEGFGYMQPNFVTKVSFASLKLPQTFGSPLISKESNIRSTCFPMACRSKHLHHTKLNSLSFPSRKKRFRSTAPLQMSYRFDTFMKSSTSPQNGNEENPPIRKLYNLTLGKLKKFFAFLVTLILQKPFNMLKAILLKHDEDGTIKIEKLKENIEVPEESEVELKGDVEDSASIPIDNRQNEGMSGSVAKISSPDEQNVLDSKVYEKVIMATEESAEESVEMKRTGAITVPVQGPAAGEIIETKSEGVQFEESVQKYIEKTIGPKIMTAETIFENENGIKQTERSNKIDISHVVTNGEKETMHSVGKIELPRGNRWAISSPDTDLSGKWKIVVTDEFKKEYDLYLKKLGQPSLVRSVAVSIVEMTTEEVIQSDSGRSLCIKGKNLRGVWDRTIISSGSDYGKDHGEGDEHTRVSLVTADKEKVEAEAWWEDHGTCHRSRLRGVKKYGGGDFESRRYLTDDGKKLVCESEFHPDLGDEEDKAIIHWTFERVA